MKYLRYFEGVVNDLSKEVLDKFYPDLHNIDDYFQSFVDTNPDLFVNVTPCCLPKPIIADRDRIRDDIVTMQIEYGDRLLRGELKIHGRNGTGLAAPYYRIAIGAKPDTVNNPAGKWINVDKIEVDINPIIHRLNRKYEVISLNENITNVRSVGFVVIDKGLIRHRFNPKFDIKPTDQRN